MKLLISNQHGAIVMALLPFLYGMFSSHPIWQHIFLLAGWFALYLMTYPFLNLFKGRNLAFYAKWSGIYAGAALILALPALYYNWRILYFLGAMLPFVLINIYFVKQKNERAFVNDVAGIIIFALAGMGAYYFSERAFDATIWLVALYPTLLFFGTTLYVKSVMRERKNPRYLQVSILFHLLCVLGFIVVGQYALALAFVPPFMRAVALPKVKLSVKQIGLIEMVISLWFLVILLFAT
ncbi:YwiC-like family protein [Necropsobacter massiliensis]|uniref:YwiC-like family protein n=1 Tax=Necropsobacter massiliensis TaxID=1400001 RepID=UPI0005960962|nr:YwiC-like family protein [Necropsobacter massiliensis]